MTEDKLIDTIWHWQVGVLRRPEMDDENGYCYEEPDGDLIYSHDPRHKKNMRLCLWEMPDGERYTTTSKVPAPRHKLMR